MVKAVIFDVDGVMLDSEPLFAAGRKHIFEKYNLVAPEGKELIGSGMLCYWSNVVAQNNSDADPAELARENFDFVLNRVISFGMHPTEGLKGLLEKLKGKYCLAVGSSSDRYYVEYVLNYLGIRQYFDAVVCGDEVANAKPHADIYLKVLSLLGVNGEECRVIEDSDNGITASVGAEIPCIALDMVIPPVQSFAGCEVKFNTLEQAGGYLLSL